MKYNIYDLETPSLDNELFQTILQDKNVKIKRIVSNTLKTAQTFEQDVDEWVIVIQGCAKIEMDGVVYKLKKGEHIFIPKNKKHTLLKTKKIVIWIAVYIS